MVQAIARNHGFGEDDLPPILIECHSLIDTAITVYPTAAIAIWGLMNEAKPDAFRAAVLDITIAVLHKALSREMAKEAFH